MFQWMKQNRKRCYPFLKPLTGEGEDDYRFFDLESITSGLIIYEDVLEEGRKLLQEGSLSRLHTVYGYPRGSQDELLQCRACLTEKEADEFLPPVEAVFKKDALLGLRCRVEKCPNMLKSFLPGLGKEIEICCHEAALFLALDDELKRTEVGDMTDYRSAVVLNAFSKQIRRQGYHSPEEEKAEPAVQSRPVLITARLNENNHSLNASFRIGTGGKLYVLKDLVRLVEAVEEQRELPLGKNLTLDFAADRIEAEGKPWYDLICRYVRDEQSRGAGAFSVDGYTGANARQVIPLRGSVLDEFYDIGKESAVARVDRPNSTDGLVFRDAAGKADLQVSAMLDEHGTFEGVHLTGSLPALYNGAKYCYSYRSGELCRMENSSLQAIQPLFKAAQGGRVSLRFGKRNLSQFYYNVLPILRENCNVSEPDAEVITGYLLPEAQFTFYLDAVNGSPLCSAKAAYGDEIFDLFDWVGNSLESRSRRDTIREAYVLQLVHCYFPLVSRKDSLFLCPEDPDSVYRLLTDGLNELVRAGAVMSTPAFDALRLHKQLSIRVGVSLESDLMNLQISSENVTLQELQDILNSYRLKKKYHRLKNGEFVELNDTVAQLSTMADTLRLSPREFVKGKLHLPAYRALYLDKMLEQCGDIFTHRDSRFRALIKNFKTVEDSDFELPASLAGVLRGYQRYGYKWLRTLSSNGFGGILADDMGLGKTLQMIAVLLAEKEEGAIGTSLIVCPASLVYNWLEEFAKFAPELSVCAVVGTQSDRTAILQRYARWDVLVTSYDLLKRDCALYEELPFLYAVLDEAQYIKNHTTAAAKSVKLLKSRHRLALTGTPIENRLSELWSIFDFVMPGFLYSYEVFRRDVEAPIVKKEDSRASAWLKKMVAPFILRRLKTDVLKDLPEKVEETRVVRFGDEQQKLYDGQVVRMKELLNSTDDDTLSRSRIQVLAELTRIRQICCDPALLFENYDSGSAKREACLDLIRSAIEGEHKVLVFSQFTSMLALLKEDLEKELIPFFELTGSTPKRERLSMVSAFNEGNVPVFLISLKAGGTGLNLTGADVVIHYDPWWNAAAQNQATDRTHRIGQNRIVTVYKLIVKNSIEEKIQQMQELKLSLAENIISSDASTLGTLSREDLLALLS